jgi:hypothetical protein
MARTLNTDETDALSAFAPEDFDVSLSEDMADGQYSWFIGAVFVDAGTEDIGYGYYGFKSNHYGQRIGYGQPRVRHHQRPHRVSPVPYRVRAFSRPHRATHDITLPPSTTADGRAHL